MNRFVRSATSLKLASRNGRPTGSLISSLTDLAKGGVGLIVTGHSYVSLDGRINDNQLGIHRDELIPDLRKLTSSVHEAGSKIVLQLSHGGAFSKKQIGHQNISSTILASCRDIWPSEMPTSAVLSIPGAFAEACVRAKKAGFDGIQLHAAHGYLLNQFLSPALNHRKDSFGGNTENRARLLVEVIRAIRRAVGDSYPLLVKLNSEDFLAGGLTVRESIEIGGILSEEKVDAIELSGGTPLSGHLGPIRSCISAQKDEAYFSDACHTFKRNLPTPMILVGGIRSIEVCRRLIDEGITDYISMSRPFIREPGLINRWKSGDFQKAKCVSGSLCLRSNESEKMVSCFKDDCL